jgi:hypothetical protein
MLSIARWPIQSRRDSARLEHRLGDALLSVLQGQQAILRAIANHDDTDAEAGHP